MHAEGELTSALVLTLSLSPTAKRFTLRLKPHRARLKSVVKQVNGTAVVHEAGFNP
jgi:hypothetical protein